LPGAGLEVAVLGAAGVAGVVDGVLGLVGREPGAVGELEAAGGVAAGGVAWAGPALVPCSDVCGSPPSET